MSNLKQIEQFLLVPFPLFIRVPIVSEIFAMRVFSTIFVFVIFFILFTTGHFSGSVEGKKINHVPLVGIHSYINCDNIHTVQPGESCRSIVRKYRINYKMLIINNKNVKIRCRNLIVYSTLCVDFLAGFP